MTRGYRLIDHTADFGVQVWGRDAAQLFERAAAALMDLLFITRGMATEREEMIDVDGRDWADLMVNWLRELLFLWAGRERVLTHVRVESLNENRLRAMVGSAAFDPAAHRLNHEIKAVTYHQVQAGPMADGREWRARVIFDV
jgi:SHS2 domain-containing protein